LKILSQSCSKDLENGIYYTLDIFYVIILLWFRKDSQHRKMSD
jgi:hypothetical protein